MTHVDFFTSEVWCRKRAKPCPFRRLGGSNVRQGLLSGGLD
ncbi:hypothetical protein [Parabacteroides faecis]|uniref:Metal-binding transcription factor (Methanogenesis marker protein 9) n=1 Tax=Parabacteroides faecis TaxID=1217282 RepID=A0ABR6KQH7_9BACT|nr:hypothetical protein [Parabacteroides faecis]MBB4623681.1 putative metal-binding transcription factor (methanogenesis marker protein 9) [Parabacteroides faecis]